MQNSLSSLGLFFQEEGGRFLEYRENTDEEGELWQNGTSYPTLMLSNKNSRAIDAFSPKIPPNASIAAFSTVKSDASKDAGLNIYLLWQDTDGTIRMSWSENNEGWQGPITHPAFAGAVNNTALACLTGITYPGFPLAAGTELARCYFQTGLALREVTFDGDSWNIVGVVPVDL